MAIWRRLTAAAVKQYAGVRFRANVFLINYEYVAVVACKNCWIP